MFLQFGVCWVPGIYTVQNKTWTLNVRMTSKETNVGVNADFILSLHEAMSPEIQPLIESFLPGSGHFLG